ncbi:hypothetical protein [Luedemannella flava]|uniref:hypothetical protein n=1 Tax=Luedemannella flava TaxID=349316 RepID=UPI0031E22BE6
MSAQPTVSPTDQPTPDMTDPVDAEAPVEAPPAEHRDVMSRRSTAALVVSGLIVALLCGAGAAFLDRTIGQDAAPAAADEVAATESLDGGAPAGDERTTADGHLIGDGQWIVGDDIDYGTFAATVPADSPGCTWERADADDGSAASVLDSGIAPPGDKVVVTIKQSDRVFRTIGCGTWIAIAN